MRTTNSYGFSAASSDEQIVFGASRPGLDIEEWLDFMDSNGIERVCCLLPHASQLGDVYKKHFGEANYCHAPVKDFHLCDITTLQQRILPFLLESDRNGQKTIVHCSAGLGRTGHVLAAWLVHARRYSIEEALRAVEKMGRRPRESVEYGETTIEELYALLEAASKRLAVR